MQDGLSGIDSVKCILGCLAVPVFVCTGTEFGQQLMTFHKSRQDQDKTRRMSLTSSLSLCFVLYPLLLAYQIITPLTSLSLPDISLSWGSTDCRPWKSHFPPVSTLPSIIQSITCWPRNVKCTSLYPSPSSAFKAEAIFALHVEQT